MKSNHRLWMSLGMAALVSGLVGCSSTPSYEERLADQVEKKESVNSEVKDMIPDWYTKAPKENENYIYATGYGVSSDLSMAEDKSSLMIHGKFAEQLGAKTDSSKGAASTDQSGNGYDSRSTQVKTVKRVFVFNQSTNYETMEKKIEFEEGQFIVYELGRFNKRRYQLEKQKAQLTTQTEPSFNQASYQEGMNELNELEQQKLNNEGKQ